MLLLAYALLSAAHPPIAAPHVVRRCSIITSEYRSKENPSYTLTFHRVSSRTGLPSDVAVLIKDGKSGADTWYYFDEGSALTVSLISTDNPTIKGWQASVDGGVRPHGPATFIGLTKGGKILNTSPTSSSAAPESIIIPELAQTLRNSRTQFSPSSFQLNGCHG